MKGLTEYELLRESKIKRNYMKMKSLGLEKGVIKPLSLQGSSATAQGKRRKKRKAIKGLPPTRFSGRVRKERIQYDVEEAYGVLDEVEGGEIVKDGKKGRRIKGGGGKDVKDVRGVKHVYKDVPEPIIGDTVVKGSEEKDNGGKKGGFRKAKEIEIRTSRMKANANKVMEERNKHTAVMWIVEHAKDVPSGVTYSKYSGVLEFKNAVVLFVNFDSKGGNYVNNWSEDGRVIKWFGGSKQSLGDDKTKRMVELGSGTHYDKGEGGVVMMARFCEGSKAQPYCYLGGLEYVEHGEERTHEGIRVGFKWRLRDTLEGGTWRDMVEWGKGK